MKTPDASTKAPRRYGHVKGRGMQRIVQGRDLELHNIVVQNRAPIIVSLHNGTAERRGRPRGGRGVLPYITYTGMCRPTGS